MLGLLVWEIGTHSRRGETVNRTRGIKTRFSSDGDMVVLVVYLTVRFS